MPTNSQLTLVPIVPHPTSVAPLAAAMDITIEEALALLELGASAWQIPGGLVVVNNVFQGHKADFHFYPTGKKESRTALFKLMDHIFDLFQLRVIHAILPVTEGVDSIMATARKMGFHQDGVYRYNRRTKNDPLSEFGDDVLMSLTATELRESAHLVEREA